MKAIEVLRELGASTMEVSFPYVNYAPALSWIIVRAEVYPCHEPLYRKRAEEYGQDVRDKLQVGLFIAAHHYLRAQRVRSLLTEQLVRVLHEMDVIVTPTVPLPAPKIGQQAIQVGRQEISMGELNRLNYPFRNAPC